MSDEVKSVVKLGNEARGNTAVITKTKADDHPNKRFANKCVRDAGQKLRPLGYQYKGSAVVHFYDNLDNANQPMHITVQQLIIGNVHENHADFGWKQLGNALMEEFGRTVPRVRS